MVFGREWQRRMVVKFLMQEEVKADTVYQNRLKIAKKDKRLLNKIDYDRVYSDPIILREKNLYILFRKNEIETARLGIALKKKIINRAVERNRLKRIMRLVFDEYIRHLPNVDLVIGFSRGIIPNNDNLRVLLIKSFNSLIKNHGKL